MLKGKTPLIVAGVFAALSGLVAFIALQRQTAQLAGEWNLVKVVVASKDIPEGANLSRENLTTATIPERFFKKSAVKPEEMSAGRIWGQKTAVPLAKGDPLLWSHIASLSSEIRLSDTVQMPSGRAVSIKVSNESAVANWVRPADHVDIIGSFRDPASGEQVALTLLQNVIVLATGEITGQTNTRVLSPSARKYNTITVHVLPEAVEMLVLAQEMGRLYLSLRNREDTAIDSRDVKTTMKTLFTGDRYKVIAKDQDKIIKAKPQVEVIKGGKGGK